MTDDDKRSEVSVAFIACSGFWSVGMGIKRNFTIQVGLCAWSLYLLK